MLFRSGQEIAFFALLDGVNANIWVIPKNGGEARQVTSESGHEISPLWWPDGKRLAFINVNIDNEIGHQLSSVRLADGKLESLTSITPGSLPYNNPRWSSDRNHIYIKRSVENRLNVWSVSVEDGSMRQLTDFTWKEWPLGSHCSCHRRRIFVFHLGRGFWRHLGNGCGAGGLDDRQNHTPLQYSGRTRSWRQGVVYKA